MVMYAQIFAILAALSVFLPGHRLGAVTIEPASLEELANESAVIVEGMVGSSRSYWGSEQRVIYTETRFEVNQVFKGDSVQRTVLIRQLGGQVGETAMEINGVQPLRKNQHLILFLQPNRGEGTYSIHSLILGKFFIEEDKAGKQTVRSAVGVPDLRQSATGKVVQFRKDFAPKPRAQFLGELDRVIRESSGEETR